jgi:hypothetical protein
MSPRLISAFVLLVAVVLSIAAWDLPDADEAMNWALGCYTLATVLWLLDVWIPRLARASAMLALIALVMAAHWALRLPQLLMPISIPAVLAVSLSGVPAGLAVAATTSLLLTILPIYGGRTDVAVALASMRAVLAPVSVISQQARDLARFSHDRFEQAQSL